MSTEAMKLALEALEQHVAKFDYEQFTSVCELDPAKDAIIALRQAIEQIPCDSKFEQDCTACNAQEKLEAILAARSARLTEQYTKMEEQTQPGAIVTSETGADISMSWWHEPALPVGTKLYTAPPPRQPLTDEAIKLRGEIGVLVGLLGAALQVIETVDGEDADECQMLMELQNKITYAIRGASGIKGEA